MYIEGNELHADRGCWLYQEEYGERWFYKVVALANIEDKDDWHECTDEEKRQWEEAHKEPTDE